MHALAITFGLAASVVLAALSAIHVFWAVRAAAPGRGVVPTNDDGELLFVPGRGATLVVAALLLLGAGMLLGRLSGVGPGGLAPFFRVGSAALGLVFLARAVGDFRWIGFFKRHKGTRFSVLDSAFYSPLCLLLAVACGVVAL